MGATKKGTVVFFCKSCHTEQEMKPVSEGFDGKIVWLKCPDCSRMIFLKNEDYEELLNENHVDVETSDDEYVYYEPSKTYQIGQWIYHEKWNDKGEVVKKEVTSSGNHTILVNFDRIGEKILIENL